MKITLKLGSDTDEFFGFGVEVGGKRLNKITTRRHKKNKIKKNTRKRREHSTFRSTFTKSATKPTFGKSATKHDKNIRKNTRKKHL